uniref:Uncharacterized protein n=1 Tax=Hyaloperonospora arabidopsidis (strain Emoy2) TaxID=559515 RepID=M4B2E9_HYAAE
MPDCSGKGIYFASLPPLNNTPKTAIGSGRSTTRLGSKVKTRRVTPMRQQGNSRSDKLPEELG